MRYVVGFICVLVLGLATVGCGEEAVRCDADDVCPCTEQGLRAAVAAGGGPYTFDCEEDTTIVTRTEIMIDKDVILDGGGEITVDGNGEHVVLSVSEGVTAELLGFTITGGEPDGIQNRGTLTLGRSKVSGNGGDSGNGIFSEAGNLTLMGVTVSGNETGVRSEGPTGPERSRLIVTNSTISGNAGYGLVSGQSETVITYTTIAENGFWGIWNGGSDLVGHGPMTVAKSIVADDCEDGPITSDGYNIESPGDTCGFNHGTDLVNITEGQLDLGELANNGGPTMTHALGADSVAIDHIPAVDCGVTTDQRGEPRPVGEGCDVGSFERQPEDP
jgi:hypothetical protein